MRDKSFHELRIGIDTFSRVAAEQKREVSRVGTRSLGSTTSGCLFFSHLIFLIIHLCKLFCSFDITLSAASEESQEVSAWHALSHVSDQKLDS